MGDNVKKGRAVIIGAGMAGLVAARVAADHYEEVWIIDCDELPETPRLRAGTPQAYHPHRLLPRGKMILEKLFPDYNADLLAHGAVSREGRFARLINPFGMMEVPDDTDASSSRALLEWVIRGRVARNPRVRFLPRHEVTGLQASQDGSAVTGVTVRARGEGGREEPSVIAADLVLLASGRSSKLDRWLASLGYEVPEPERLKVNLGYSTRYYKLPPNVVDRWSAIVIDGIPAEGIASGALTPIENDTAEMVLFLAGGAAYPTTDGTAYEREAAELLHPAIAELLPRLEPLAEPRGYRVEECVRRRYDRMERWPSGLLPLGDAICGFDPVYGQGMTVAAIEAEVLDACLKDRGSEGFELQAIRRMQSAIEPAWWLSAIADLRWPGVTCEGTAYPGARFLQAYFDLCLHEGYAKGNMDVFLAYMMMTGLLASPHQLINPQTINGMLAGDPSAEKERLLAELREEGGDLRELLARIVPPFEDAGTPLSGPDADPALPEAAK